MVTALLLGLFGMLMVAALLFMVSTGTWTSGSKKRYQMALDAAYGGRDFFAREIVQRALAGTELDNMDTYDGLFAPIINNADFQKKLNTTGIVGDGTYPDDMVDATLTFSMPNNPAIQADLTIVSTGRGNSGKSGYELETGGVVNNSSGTITPQHFPYLYHMEIEAYNASNRIENARLSTIYIY
ncbi:MAG: hypothetical protein Q4G66_07360 [bacterium]|nr:hypothetical protein [bacterium]